MFHHQPDGGQVTIRWDRLGADYRFIEPGIYFVRIEQGGEVIAKKVVSVLIVSNPVFEFLYSHIFLFCLTYTQCVCQNQKFMQFFIFLALPLAQ